MLGDPGDRFGKPRSSLPIISVAMVAPLGAVNSRACVSRCVSPPTTASTTSANMGMRPRISFQP
jgi:hypothetical protein